MNIFEKASRIKLRFPSSKGMLATEDLWDLPLTEGQVNLDDLAKMINKRLREESEESFVLEKSSKSEKTELQMGILKHIISVRLAEAKAKEEALVNKAQLDKIEQIIRDKEDSKLASLSLEELQALRNNIAEHNVLLQLIIKVDF